MPKLYADGDKYGYQSASPIVEAYNSALKDLMRLRFEESGLEWGEFVADASYELVTKEDMQGIEAQLLEFGYRFEPSALSSARERQDAYKAAGLYNEDFSFEHEGAPTPVKEGDLELRGVGDNVVTQNVNLVGTAYYVCDSVKVLDYLSNGVPENTIAIVEDSGGTLTAPVLEKFKAVLCAGGTTRSHLAILTREYGIPCLMNVRLSGIKDGDGLEIEVSARAKTTDDYQSGRESAAKVWRLTKC